MANIAMITIPLPVVSVFNWLVLKIRRLSTMGKLISIAGETVGDYQYSHDDWRYTTIQIENVSKPVQCIYIKGVFSYREGEPRPPIKVPEMTLWLNGSLCQSGRLGA